VAEGWTTFSIAHILIGNYYTSDILEPTEFNVNIS